MHRKQWPSDVAEKILVDCKRMCAICFHLLGDPGLNMRGQIAHIDRNSANSTVENGAYRCKDHHDEYDILSKQSKRLTPGELKLAVASLLEYVQAGGLPTAPNIPTRSSKRRRRDMRISIDLYDRRLAIYSRTVQFLREVAKDLKPTFPVILQFTRDIEEAPFLFDESIAQYLENLSNKAFRLHALEVTRTGWRTDDREIENFREVVKEQVALSVWFTEQYVVIRKNFAPFLRLA
jgi:hypothetical protein